MASIQKAAEPAKQRFVPKKSHAVGWIDNDAAASWLMQTRFVCRSLLVGLLLACRRPFGFYWLQSPVITFNDLGLRQFNQIGWVRIRVLSGVLSPRLNRCLRLAGVDRLAADRDAGL